MEGKVIDQRVGIEEHGLAVDPNRRISLALLGIKLRIGNEAVERVEVARPVQEP
jgi:hypothetical protein